MPASREYPNTCKNSRWVVKPVRSISCSNVIVDGRSANAQSFVDLFDPQDVESKVRDPASSRRYQELFCRTYRVRSADAYAEY
jgi:hypothetical protein